MEVSPSVAPCVVAFSDGWGNLTIIQSEVTEALANVTSPQFGVALLALPWAIPE